MTEVTEYDPHDLKRPRTRRISTITGRPTKLTEETELQIAIVVHYDKRCEMDRYLKAKTRLYAVSPNDGKRTLAQTMIAKRKGARKGIYDLCLLDKRHNRFRIVWIEAKGADGYLTKEQREYRDFLSDTPVETCEVQTLDQFMKVLGE